MSTTPQGTSILQLYRLYRLGRLFVNRQYQRKLVWSKKEKATLIDSILRAFPIPLILLAEYQEEDITTYEIIDGMQRLNAIFSFIENEFPVNDCYFDINEHPLAKELAGKGVFTAASKEDHQFLPQGRSGDFLEYPLAITTFKASSPEEVNEVFGRINSNGKHLSPQEVRQAGVMSPFATLVRQLAAELRNDATKEILPLYDMPEISIDSKQRELGYGIAAEDTFWCSQGIIRIIQLRESEDEQIIADLVLSIALETPLASSKDVLDSFYGKGDLDDQSGNIDIALKRYGLENLKADIKAVFSAIRTGVAVVNGGALYLKKVLNPDAGSNPVKEPFYTMFMAFYNLMIKEGKAANNYPAIFGALTKLAERLEPASKSIVVSKRVTNINIAKGLIQDYFKPSDPSHRSRGSLAIDLENYIRRSKIEAPYYDFKQGLVTLSPGRRKFDEGAFEGVMQNIAAMANLGKGRTGYLFLGVTDREDHTLRVEGLDGITAPRIGTHGIVGLDREAPIIGQTPDQYLMYLGNRIRASALPDTLKMAVANVATPISYNNLTVLMLEVRAGAKPVVYNGVFYHRVLGQCVPAKTAEEIDALYSLFL